MTEELFGIVLDQARYRTAAHAMQSAVAAELAADPTSASPKHLRVGVNSAMAEHAGLAQLLIAKGVITPDEYVAAMADGMEQEASRCAEAARAKAGLPPTVTFK